MMAHKDAVQMERYKQHAEELQKTSGLTLMEGIAKMTGDHAVSVSTDEGEKPFSAKNILIASGSDVWIPPISGADLCLTSHDLNRMHSSLHSLPDSMIVIGGGYVGLETASFFAAFGSSVTLLEREENILFGIDPEIVALLLPGLSSLINGFFPRKYCLLSRDPVAGLSVTVRTEQSFRFHPRLFFSRREGVRSFPKGQKISES